MLGAVALAANAVAAAAVPRGRCAMGEVIAIPLASERRAAAVLAALRRLEAEYRAPPPAPGSAPRRCAGRAPAGLRRVLQRAGVPGLTGGIIGLTIAAVYARATNGLHWVPALLDDARRAPLGVAVGGALGVALGLTLPAARRRGTRRGAAEGPAHDPGDASWLITFVTVERDGSASARTRTAVRRISLPGAAEGRLKAILEWAASTPAP